MTQRLRQAPPLPGACQRVRPLGCTTGDLCFCEGRDTEGAARSRMSTSHPTRLVEFTLLATLLGISLPFVVEDLVKSYSVPRLIATIAFFSKTTMRLRLPAPTSPPGGAGWTHRPWPGGAGGS